MAQLLTNNASVVDSKKRIKPETGVYGNQTTNGNFVADVPDVKKAKVDIPPAIVVESKCLPVPVTDPDLERYWKTVRDNPDDFAGWTYLLQYVESIGHIPECRKAFDAFLNKFPYCYGYWKKLADIEKKANELDLALAVYERGVQAIPLSIDLWIHYINFYIEHYTCLASSNRATGVKKKDVEQMFERGVTTAGIEYRSLKLWILFIDWAVDIGDLKKSMDLYDRCLQCPILGHSQHFQKLKDFVKNNLPFNFLPSEEFFRLRSVVVAEMKASGKDIFSGESSSQDDLPPGVDIDPTSGLDDIVNESDNLPNVGIDDPFVEGIRDLVVKSRKEVFDKVELESVKRKPFEDSIKRPYFHVKPLEKSQLSNWRDYLKFEIEHGSKDRIVFLFERCLIACALYEEFWLQYVTYLRGCAATENVRHVYKRACTIHLLHKPSLVMDWAGFEEQQGDPDKAVALLKDFSVKHPKLLMVTVRLSGIERRRKNFSGVEAIYRQAIENASSPDVASFFALKLSRFFSKIVGDLDAASKVILDAIPLEYCNEKLYLQLLDIEYSKSPFNEDNIISIFESVNENKEVSDDCRLMFSQRKQEFLEEFGMSIGKVLTAYNEHQSLASSMPGLKPSGSSDYLRRVIDQHIKVKENAAKVPPPQLTMNVIQNAQNKASVHKEATPVPNSTTSGTAITPRANVYHQPARYYPSPHYTAK